MSTFPSPTFTATSTTTQISETRSSTPSSTRKSVPSPRYLYGIILVVVILALFVCFCTAREVIRRQRRGDGTLPPREPEEDEEEFTENMVKPEMYEIYFDEAVHFRESPNRPVEWKTLKPLSTSFVPQSPPLKHESFCAALGGLIVDNLASVGRQVRSGIWPKRKPDELPWESRSSTPMSGLVLSSVFISMPAPGRQRYHMQRPSFSMSETSGDRTVYECPMLLEETLFAIHEERWSEMEKT